MTATKLEREIAEQPQAVARVSADADGMVAAAAEHLSRASAVMIAARGSSDNAARYAQHLFGRLCRLPVALATPSLYTAYGTPPRLERTLVIGISQSGESPDIRAVLADAADQGQRTLAITNNPASPLARTADLSVDLAAGPELSVAATKSYTASLAAVAMLAALAAGDRSLLSELDRLPSAMSRQLELGLDSHDRFIAASSRAAVAGRGANLATAFEGALKVTELTGLTAEPHSTADLMHGPVAALGPDSPLVIVAPSGPTADSTRAACEAAELRGAAVLAIGDERSLAPDAAWVPTVPVPEWLSPLVAILPLQLLALATALERGVDVDEPFSLTKVTRTR